MKQGDSPVRITLLHMRLLPEEHTGTKACNDADSPPTLRTGVHHMDLPAPLDAQAWADVRTGLSSCLQCHTPHTLLPLYRKMMRLVRRSQAAARRARPAQ